MNTDVKNQNQSIANYIKTIETDHNNFYSIYFNLSKLDKRNKSNFQIKIALNVIKDFFKQNKGELFLCKNYDLIVIVESQTRDLIEKIIHQLRYLFIDDQIAYKKHNEPNKEFCRVFMLAFQWDEFIDICKKQFEFDYHALSQKDLDKKKLVNNTFQQIDNDLSNLHLSNFLRKQNISLMLSNGDLKKVFSEIYVNLATLKEHLGYKDDFLSGRLLCKYLEDRLNNCLLELLQDNVSKLLSGSTNINLNIETILSKQFMEFHNYLRSITDASVVIDIDYSDIFMDIQSFFYANDLLKELGYKICIEGVDSNSFQFINRESLNVDLIKFRWDSQDITQVDKSLIRSYIQKCNPHRVIMTHCYDYDALAYGKELGIVLYQGWWVEQQLNKNLEIV